MGAAGATVPEAVLVSGSQTEMRMRRRMGGGTRPRERGNGEDHGELESGGCELDSDDGRRVMMKEAMFQNKSGIMMWVRMSGGVGVRCG